MPRDKHSDKTDNVVQVVFGDGGGRRHAGLFTPDEELDATREREIFGQAFSTREVARMTGLSLPRLKQLRDDKLVVGRAADDADDAETNAQYTFSDLIALRVVAGLLAGNIRQARIKSAVRALAERLPDVQFPLQELHVSSDGRQIIVRSDKLPFEPITGQLLLDFSVDELQADIARLCRPTTPRDRQRLAQERYMEATKLDEDPTTWARAEALYDEALTLWPGFAIALTNMGNLYARQDRTNDAEALYLRALDVEPRQPEAHYNLGFLAMDRCAWLVSINYFEAALQADNRFADAHFNLGLAYEALGNLGAACTHWDRYVQLEPCGPWAHLAASNARLARASADAREPRRMGPADSSGPPPVVPA